MGEFLVGIRRTAVTHCVVFTLLLRRLLLIGLREGGERQATYQRDG
jgi:hypothetical protein